MPHVEVSRVIPGDRPRVYAVSKDFERLVKHMPDVVSLDVLEKTPAATVTRWVGRLQGRLMTWVEREEFSDAAFHTVYKQLEGDLKQMEGEWRFEPVDGETKVTLTCDFDLGLEMWAALLNPIAMLVVRQNLAKMLEGLEAAVREESGGMTP